MNLDLERERFLQNWRHELMFDKKWNILGKGRLFFRELEAYINERYQQKQIHVWFICFPESQELDEETSNKIDFESECCCICGNICANYQIHVMIPLDLSNKPEIIADLEIILSGRLGKSFKNLLRNLMQKESMSKTEFIRKLQNNHEQSNEIIVQDHVTGPYRCVTIDVRNLSDR